jgi:hypothetical protein
MSCVRSSLLFPSTEARAISDAVRPAGPVSESGGRQGLYQIVPFVKT